MKMQDEMECTIDQLAAEMIRKTTEDDIRLQADPETNCWSETGGALEGAISGLGRKGTKAQRRKFAIGFLAERRAHTVAGAKLALKILEGMPAAERAERDRQLTEKFNLAVAKMREERAKVPAPPEFTDDQIPF